MAATIIMICMHMHVLIVFEKYFVILVLYIIYSYVGILRCQTMARIIMDGMHVFAWLYYMAINYKPM